MRSSHMHKAGALPRQLGSHSSYPRQRIGDQSNIQSQTHQCGHPTDGVLTDHLGSRLAAVKVFLRKLLHVAGDLLQSISRQTTALIASNAEESVTCSCGVEEEEREEEEEEEKYTEDVEVDSVVPIIPAKENVAWLSPPSKTEKCHTIFRLLVCGILWTGLVSAIVLCCLGIFLKCHNCLTVGVILGITCIGVLLHNCLRRSSIPQQRLSSYSIEEHQLFYPELNSNNLMFNQCPVEDTPPSTTSTPMLPLRLSQQRQLPESITEGTAVNNSLPDERGQIKEKNKHHPNYPQRRNSSSASSNTIGQIKHDNCHNYDSSGLDLVSSYEPHCYTICSSIQDELGPTCPPHHSPCDLEAQLDRLNRRIRPSHATCSSNRGYFTLNSLTNAIFRSLTRGRNLEGEDGPHHQRNAWNSFEGHVGWQSARARAGPFNASHYR